MFDFDRRRPRLSAGTVVHTGPTPSTATTTRPSDENDDATDDSTDTLSDDGVPIRQDADGRRLTSPAFEEVFRYGN